MSRRIPSLITARLSLPALCCSMLSALSRSTTRMRLMLSRTRSPRSPRAMVLRLVSLSPRRVCSLIRVLITQLLLGALVGLRLVMTKLASAQPATPVCRMPAHSSSPRLLSPSTAGVRTRLSRPSSSSTARIVSASARAPTLTRCSPTSTTLAPRTRASTCTRSPYARRSTSPLARATSRALTTRPSSSSSPTPRLAALRRPRCASTRRTTTSSVSSAVWVV